VLPRGFAKIRSYGLLSPSHRTTLERARHLLQHHAAAIAPAHQPPAENPAAPAAPATAVPTAARCPICHGAQLRFLQRCRPARAPP
jgi:hypothetical protein